MTKRNPDSTREIRSDKRIRVNPSLSQENMGKLKSLAIACDVPPTRLAQKMLEICLNSPQFVEDVQKSIYPCKNKRYKISPIVINGECRY